MKKSTIALAVITLFISVGCSDKGDSKPAEAPATSAAPVAPKMVLAKDVPAEIKDLPFETDGQCAFDIINKPVQGEVVAVNRAEGLTLDGWALDEKSEGVSDAVVLQLAKGEERYYATLNRHSGRDDLPKIFGKPVFLNAGVGGSIDIGSLPEGQYEVLIVQKGEGKNLVCSTKHSIDLKG